MYSILHYMYMIKFVSDLRQVGGFIRVLRFPPSNKTDHHDITETLLKVALNTRHQYIFAIWVTWRVSYKRQELLARRGCLGLPRFLWGPFWSPFKLSAVFLCCPRPVSCVPFIASFSGLSILDCHFGFLNVYLQFRQCLVFVIIIITLVSTKFDK